MSRPTQVDTGSAQTDAPAAGPDAGLTGEQAQARLRAEGRNELARTATGGLVAAVWHQLRDVVILVLLVAATLTAAVGDMTDTGVILAVIVLNTALGTVQERRSGKALAALAELTAPRARVVRDGRPRDVDAAEVVRGDVVLLAAGDIVPADAQLAAGENLMVDESTMTGESLPVDKAPGDRVLASTVVTRGRGRAVVVSTAGATAVGGIAGALGSTRASATPVQRQLAALGRRLAAVVAVAALAVAVLEIGLGRGLETSVVLALSLAVAAIPESLPAVVSLALSMAAHRMSTVGVLVRRLPAAEALGSVTVLASDKTGTLTEGRLTVRELWTPGSDSSGIDEPDERGALLTALVLCNDACAGPDGRPAEHDDPLEVALVQAAADADLDVAACRAAHPRLSEQPFDVAAARMVTTHRFPDGSIVELTKGAPERVLAGLPDADRALRVADELARAGRRVLAVTRRRDGAALPGTLPETVGLVAFVDPVRADAPDVVAAFARCGVRTEMLTGDHRDTARVVAEAVGIPPRDVYARVGPADKARIVTELRGAGEVVAVTGDGVNDAPALRGADVGVAIGSRATEVARQAADVVLTRDDLAPLVAGIAEGRRTHDNLRRYLHYALSGGTAEILIMLVGPLIGFGIPLRASQILWVNLLTHGLPGVALGNEPAEPDVLARPPRPPDERLLDRVTGARVLTLGAAIAAACLGAGLWADAAGRPWQSVIFVSLTLAQLTVAFALRPATAGWRDNPMLPAAALLNVLLVAAAVAWPPLREVLRTEPLDALDWALAVGVAVVAGAVARLQRHSAQRHSTQRHSGDRHSGDRHSGYRHSGERPAGQRRGRGAQPEAGTERA